MGPASAYGKKRFSRSAVETARVERPPRGNNTIIILYTSLYLFIPYIVGGGFSDVYKGVALAAHSYTSQRPHI